MIFKSILNWFLTLKIRYFGSPEKLLKAVQKAEKLHRSHGKRYRVYFIGGKYQVMTRHDVQRKKAMGEWNRRVNMTRMEPMEYFDTENGYSNEGKILIEKIKKYGFFNH